MRIAERDPGPRQGMAHYRQAKMAGVRLPPLPGRPCVNPSVRAPVRASQSRNRASPQPAIGISKIPASLPMKPARRAAAGFELVCATDRAIEPRERHVHFGGVHDLVAQGFGVLLDQIACQPSDRGPPEEAQKAVEDFRVLKVVVIDPESCPARDLQFALDDQLEILKIRQIGLEFWSRKHDPGNAAVARVTAQQPLPGFQRDRSCG